MDFLFSIDKTEIEMEGFGGLYLQWYPSTLLVKHVLPSDIGGLFIKTWILKKLGGYS